MKNQNRLNLIASLVKKNKVSKLTESTAELLEQEKREEELKCDENYVRKSIKQGQSLACTD